MTKQNNDNLLFPSKEERKRQVDQSWSIGDSYQFRHNLKMVERTERWKDGLLQKLHQSSETGNYSRRDGIKLKLAMWLNRHYRNAAYNNTGKGLVSLLAFLGFEIFRLVLTLALYALLAALLIWGSPYFFEWLFHI